MYRSTRSRSTNIMLIGAFSSMEVERSSSFARSRAAVTSTANFTIFTTSPCSSRSGL